MNFMLQYFSHNQLDRLADKILTDDINESHFIVTLIFICCTVSPEQTGLVVIQVCVPGNSEITRFVLVVLHVLTVIKFFVLVN
jgi:hypothetical protein